MGNTVEFLPPSIEFPLISLEGRDCRKSGTLGIFFDASGAVSGGSYFSPYNRLVEAPLFRPLGLPCLGAVACSVPCTESVLVERS